ncbi:phosphotransferase [Micromonospora sp. NPDC049047]|uniref:phosphotransferase family protein n=1 Tax=Micromonospora sp. NPDC049047 TaxID=3155645 RepID=UPI0033FD24F9
MSPKIGSHPATATRYGPTCEHYEKLAPLSTVPCHLDFMPRNMIYGGDGIVRLIDFEHSRYDLAPRDLVRLATRIWPLRPDLRESLLNTYGPLTAANENVMQHCAHLDALTKGVRMRSASPKAPMSQPTSARWDIS